MPVRRLARPPQREDVKKKRVNPRERRGEWIGEEKRRRGEGGGLSGWTAGGDEGEIGMVFEECHVIIGRHSIVRFDERRRHLLARHDSIRSWRSWTEIDHPRTFWHLRLTFTRFRNHFYSQLGGETPYAYPMEKMCRIMQNKIKNKCPYLYPFELRFLFTATSEARRLFYK